MEDITSYLGLKYIQLFGTLFFRKLKNPAALKYYIVPYILRVKRLLSERKILKSISFL